MLPIEKESYQRRKIVKVENLSIPLPTAEDLIIMKAVAHRKQDLADIEAVLLVNPKVDLKRVLKWVGEFSKILEMPELLKDLKKIIRTTK